ncbi:MAG: AAA family ATPase [Rickettsia endosymbiont of Ixodes persulcatus]|nr:AAA family ATPase [Rickettsia endosymbiont of Ixodes persulcatus]
MNNESFYSEKGLPYKRGYILHGKPGCGKTSLIKAVANNYQLPIFILDLSILTSNNELTTAVSEINSFVTSDEKYLLIMEDVDRSKLFKNRKNNYYYEEESKKGITDDCLLNVLDGVDENYGRITIMTANDFEILNSLKALMRPGRIDMIVNISHCSNDQINNILKSYYPESEFKLDDGIQITPAKLIQLILVLGSIERIISVLNKYKSFDDVSIEKVLNFKNITNINDDNGNINNSDDDENSEDDIASEADLEDKYNITWRERQLKNQTKRLKHDKTALEIMEKQLDIKNEKEKLLLDRKRITVKLAEISLQERKNFLNSKYDIKNLKIKYDSLNLKRLDDCFNKDNKDKKINELIDEDSFNNDLDAKEIEYIDNVFMKSNSSAKTSETDKDNNKLQMVIDGQKIVI